VYDSSSFASSSTLPPHPPPSLGLATTTTTTHHHHHHYHLEQQHTWSFCQCLRRLQTGDTGPRRAQLLKRLHEPNISQYTHTFNKFFFLDSIRLLPFFFFDRNIWKLFSTKQRRRVFFCQLP
jgi:hypothetical protein